MRHPERARARLNNVNKLCDAENAGHDAQAISEAKFWEICDPVRKVASQLVSKGATVRVYGHYFMKTKYGNLACVIRGKWAGRQSQQYRLKGVGLVFRYRIKRWKFWRVLVRKNGVWQQIDRARYLKDALESAFKEDDGIPF